MSMTQPLTRRPSIGVFDSGVGGLTVLKALRRHMPERDFLYLGDTARVPYGRKPREMVVEFAREITAFLCGLGVEGVVVACNTASAAALPALSNLCAVPVWGVIEPGVEAAARCTRTGKVGVIGTKGTIASRAYQGRLEALGLTVWAQACPMLVHLVEEGLAESPEAELLVGHYLESCKGIDTLILGCTHYPLLAGVLQRAVGPGVTLVDSAEVTAERVSATLGADLEDTRPGRVTHYVTGDPLAFEHTARVIGEVAGEIIPLPVTELAAQVEAIRVRR
jgi:glutamate racemase